MPSSARLASFGADFGEASECEFGESSARLASFGADFGEASECEFGEALEREFGKASERVWRGSGVALSASIHSIG